MSQAQATVTERTGPAVGDVIGRYKLIGVIGHGGMGVVFEAEDQSLRRTVALKFLHAEVAQDPKRRRRFLREGKLAAQLTHPCITAVYEAGEEGDLLYIAMELVRGRKLSDVIAAQSPPPLADAVRIAREVGRGLAKAHEVGIIHRDLKPDNVMIGDDGIVKILDFGVAKVLEGSQSDFTGVQTHAGSLVGTPAYMSPEQAAGKDTDGRSDLFSLGVVLYELVTGRQPFRGDTWQETIIAINRDTAARASELRPGLPAELDRILDRCLGKKPEERYPAMRELLVDLDALIAIQTTLPEGPSPVVTADSLPPLPMPAADEAAVRDVSVPPARKERTTQIVAALGTALVVTGIGYLLSRPAAAPSDAAPPSAASAPAPVTAAPASSAPPSIEPSTAVPSAAAPSTPASSAAPEPPRRRRPAASAATVTPVAPPPETSVKPRPKNPLLGF